MTRSSSSASSTSSVYSSDSKAHSSVNAHNRKAGLAVSRMHGHHGSVGNALLRPPSASEAQHRRVASMPDTSHPGPHRPVEWGCSPSSATGSTERNFGAGSPPIFDFTTFEDRYRNSSSTGLHNSFLAVSPSSKDGRRVVSDQGAGVRKQSAGDSPIISTSISWPDSDMIIETLEDVLSEDTIRQSYDLEGLIGALHQQEELRDDLPPVKASRKLTVFGQPLSEVVRYASKAIFFGNGRTGATLSLPLVIVLGVEELYKTGIYQPNLFRSLPNRSRLLDLISIFDSMDRPSGIKCSTRPSAQNSTCKEEFGAMISLQLESTADICALFTSYLSALPEPLIPAHVFDAIWVLCDLEIVPPINRDPSFAIDPNRQTPTILLAQLFLHLLPQPNFSLLVYLLAFFSQTVLANEENGVDIRDLAKMFGARLFGNGTTPIVRGPPLPSKSKGKTLESSTMSPSRGETMMAWFLRRWTCIFDSLFEVVEDAKMGVYRRNRRLRKDSLGRPALQRRREKDLKKCSSRLTKVPSEGDTTSTPKAPQKARLRPQKAMTLDAPSLQASLSAFRFPVAASPELGSEDNEISPTTVVPSSGLYDVGTEQKLGSKAANEGLGLRGHLKTARVAPSRSRSEPRASAPVRSRADSRRGPPDDEYSYDHEPAMRSSPFSNTHRNVRPPSIHHASSADSDSSYRHSRSQTMYSPSSPTSMISKNIQARLYPSDEDTLANVRGSAIVDLNANSRDLLDELLLEVTMPSFPSSPHLGVGLDSTIPLSRQKAIHKTQTQTPNRRSTVDSSSASDSLASKKSSLPASSGRSHIPLSSMRRTQSKTEDVTGTPERHRKEAVGAKDEEICKLRLMVKKVKKERDEAVRVLEEVQKMLGVVQ